MTFTPPALTRHSPQMHEAFRTHKPKVWGFSNQDDSWNNIRTIVPLVLSGLGWRP